MIDGAGALLAQVSSTLDAADRLGRAPASVILAAVVLVLAGALVVTVREVMRLHTARLADAAAPVIPEGMCPAMVVPVVDAPPGASSTPRPRAAR